MSMYSHLASSELIALLAAEQDTDSFPLILQELSQREDVDRCPLPEALLRERDVAKLIQMVALSSFQRRADQLLKTDAEALGEFVGRLSRFSVAHNFLKQNVVIRGLAHVIPPAMARTVSGDYLAQVELNQLERPARQAKERVQPQERERIEAEQFKQAEWEQKREAKYCEFLVKKPIPFYQAVIGQNMTQTVRNALNLAQLISKGQVHVKTIDEAEAKQYALPRKEVERRIIFPGPGEEKQVRTERIDIAAIEEATLKFGTNPTPFIE